MIAKFARDRRRIVGARLACAVLLGFGAVGAGTAGADGAVAATVNGVEISESRLLGALAEEAVAQGGGVDAPAAPNAVEVSPGVLDANVARPALATMVITAAVDQFFDSPLFVPTDDPATSTLPGDWAAPPTAAPAAPGGLAGLQAELTTRGERLNATAAPSADVLAAAYDERPARTGVPCVVAELVDTVDTAGTIATEPGVVRCYLLGEREQLDAELGPDASARLIAGSPGDLVAVVDGDAGELRLVIADYATAEDALNAAIEPFVTGGNVGQVYAFGFIVTSDIRVDDRWGRWDPAALAVVA